MVKPKRGRPPSGGRDPFVGVRLPASLLEQIGTWSEKHETATRSEAIRRLVELGLKALPSKKGRSDQTMKDSDGRIIPSLPASGLKAKK